MIKCPNCGNTHVSIVSVASSKKKEYETLDLIQGGGITGVFLSVFFFIMCMIGAAENAGDILGNAFSISNITNATGELIFETIAIFLTIKLFKWSFIIWVIAKILQHFLPHETISYDKCICHECETQWVYTKPVVKEPEPEEEIKYL